MQNAGAADVAGRYQTALQGPDDDGLRELLSDGLARRIPAGSSTGQADFELLDVVTSDDKIAARVAFTVTSDNVPGAQPGRQARVTGMTMATVRDGKIVDVQHELDLKGMLQQLGAS